MIKKLYYGFMILAMCSTAAFSQDIIFSRNYGGVGSSQLGMCGNTVSDGGYVISGVSYAFSGLNGEFWLVRTDSNGDTLWTRHYGGERWQEAHYVVQTDDGGFVLCGGTSITVGDDDMFIVKTDANGDTMWTRNFGVAGEDDIGWAITQTSDEGYVAVGHGYAGGSTQLFMVRLDADGGLLWTKYYGGSYSDYGYGVVETPDGGFALTGTYSVSSSYSDVWLLRTDSSGDTLWTQKYDFHSNKDRGDQIVMTPDSGFAIGGRTWNGTYPQLLALRTDSLGTVVWSREFGTAADEFAESIDITPDGGFVIGGGAGPYPFDYYIVRVSSNGDSLWAATYDFDGLPGDSEDCYEVRVDADGNIIAFGYADVSSSGYDSDYWMIKILDNAQQVDGYLAGQVLEEDEATAIEGVNVDVFDIGNNLIESDITDSNGDFFFTMNPDTYYAVFSKENYLDTVISNIDVTADETTFVEVVMQSTEYLYLPGDANMYNGIWPPAVIGSDVTYLVGYFRGVPVNQPCLLDGFWASSDANGDCNIIGSDVTRLVNYFRAIGDIDFCPDYPPAWLTHDDPPQEMPDGWPNCD